MGFDEMIGYAALPSTQNQNTLHNITPWEAQIADAVGHFIEYWGFKRNHGRVWALLYLRGLPLTSNQIQKTLGLSKGAISMITRELEQWGVLHRVRSPDSNPWKFVAETDLMAMVSRVLQQREANIILRIKTDLKTAEATARATGNLQSDELDRISRLTKLASLAESALQLFVRTAHVDVQRAMTILNRPFKSLRKGKGKI
ncbi:MAG: MarR family transcriptional regulator [Pseudomonadota bacterium]